MSSKVRLKLATGVYSQNLLSATSDRDVVNLFYGFLSNPENLPAQFDGKERLFKRQQAYHAIVGLELDPITHVSINVEAYWKNFNQLINVNRNKLYDDTPNNANVDDLLKKDFILERGIAKGIDTRISYDRSPWYLWTTYSWAVVNRYDGIQTYFPHFDRRHTVNVVASYRLGKRRLWELSSRWNYGSGFPFTPTRGFFEEIQLNDGLLTDYIHQNGTLGVLYGELNTQRLPSYHRLDLSAKRQWNLGKTTKLGLTLALSNVYNRKNIFYFDRLRYERLNQLPILPSAGVLVKF